MALLGACGRKRDRGNRRRKQSGGHAMAGADFHAYLGACVPFEMIAPTIENQSRDGGIAAQNLIRTPIKLKVQPNPFWEETTLLLTLPETTPINIQLFNQIGQRVKTILSSKAFMAGTHQLQLSNAGLMGGLYYVIVQTETQSINKKILLINSLLPKISLKM